MTTEQELSGLLNRALDGYDRLKAQNEFTVELGSSDSERLDNYRKKADPVVSFAETCVEENQHGYMLDSTLYNVFKRFCRDEFGRLPDLSKAKFYDQLERKTTLPDCRKQRSIPTGFTSSQGREITDRVRMAVGVWFTPEGTDYLSEGDRADVEQVMKAKSDRAQELLLNLPHSGDPIETELGSIDTCPVPTDAIGRSADKRRVFWAARNMYIDNNRNAVDRTPLEQRCHDEFGPPTGSHGYGELIDELLTGGYLYDIGGNKLEPQ